MVVLHGHVVRHGDMIRSRSMTSIGTDHTAPPRQRDPFVECATLFWLGQSERALLALCRGPAAEQNTFSLDRSVATAPPALAGATANSIRHGSSLASRKEPSASTVAMEGAAGLIICNRAIDVATRPFLVSKLEVIHRERKPIPARNTFGRRGSYMSSPDHSWHSAPTSDGNDAVSAKGKAKGRVDNALRAAAVRLTTVEYLARNGMEISALEVLGNASGKKWAVELADLAEEKEKKPTVGEGNYPVSSSKSRKVFKKTVSFEQDNTGELSGDMFGGFDGPPQMKPKAPAGSAIASGELSGDIFGGFDGPPVQKRVTPAAATASSMKNSMVSGELSGDMFGSFDAPPSRQEAKKPVASTANALASGELSGDLFGGFDGPKRSPKKPQQPNPRGRKSIGHDDSVASGQLSSDLFAAFDSPASSGIRVSSSLNSPTSPGAIWTPGSSRHGLASPNNSGGENSVKSYGYREGEEPSWEAYDTFVAEDNDQTNGVDKR